MNPTSAPNGEWRERSAESAERVSDYEYAAICQFLYTEAEALDNRDYEAWVELVSDDFTYLVPTPRTPDNPFSPHWDERALLIDESKWSLKAQWFRRFDKDVYEMAWGDNPPVRFRHMITNVRVRWLTVPSSLEVKSNVLLSGTRQSDLPKFLTAERTDTLRWIHGRLQLVRRWVVLDQVLIDFPQLRIIL
jgi:3-phenylpropionate/cinnamic acid dioxygenase small subunit